MFAGTTQEKTTPEETVTELMDESRRDAMRTQGWRMIRIDRRKITWRRDIHVVAAESK